MYYVNFREYELIFTSHLQTLNDLQSQNGRESNVWINKVCTVIAKKKRKKKKTFSEKAKQRAVIKFCAGIGNTPTEIEISETVGKKHKNENRSLVFKWQKRFSDERENVMDNVWDGKPSFRYFGP